MKSYLRTKSALPIVLALFLSACGGGGGSGTTGVTDGPSAGGIPDDGGSSGDNGNSAGPVTVAITSPASGDDMETPDVAVILEGTAFSAAPIVSVSWSTTKGDKGTASGTESWKSGSIPLATGENQITVTATDSAGESASKTITIHRDSGAVGSVTLSWEPPTTREDGSPLTNLAGYRIKYGRMSKIYDYEIEIDNPGLSTYVVENLKPGKWHFVATAYDTAGLESDFSAEASLVLPGT